MQLSNFGFISLEMAGFDKDGNFDTLRARDICPTLQNAYQLQTTNKKKMSLQIKG